MLHHSAIKFETAVPMLRRAGEPFPLQAWTWWTSQVITLMAQLPGSQGPWTTWTESYRWLTWIVRDELQLQRLIEFVSEPVTFGIVE